jgi:hypothetical protein
MMRNKFLASAIAAACVAALSGAAIAAPQQWTSASGGNDHWYDYVLLPTGGGFTWDGAAADAPTHSYLGVTGYMATVTSQGEQDFIHGTVTATTAWLGGNDRALEGTWRWIFGPEAGSAFYVVGAGSQPGYSFWNGGEPNDCCSGEDDLQINWDTGTGRWNDHGTPSWPNDTWGYIVEYSGTPVNVPEPTSLLLAGLGLVGLATLRRRQVGTR